MTTGVLDLSIVTDQLLAQLRTARDHTHLWEEEPSTLPPPAGTTPVGTSGIPAGDTTPSKEFDIVFTGMPPDAARNLSGNCKVSLYLFHVAPDKYYRNTYPADWSDSSKGTMRPRQGAAQPLALTLYYLLSAHSESYIEEQQAMSIALKCFHDQAIVTATVPLHSRKQEFTVTMEPETIDEIGRLWQSVSTPLRLSAVYRASVIFLEPEAETREIKRVKKDGWHVAAYPQFLVTRAEVNTARYVKVWGRRFDDTTLEVRVDGTLLTRTTTAPTATTYKYVDAEHLELQLPAATVSGRHRLGVKIAAEPVEAVFTLEVP